jgi:acyl-CoA thioester hydrolase
MPQPTYADLTARIDLLPAHQRLVVPPEFEDHNGHMNIAHYLTTTSWGVQHAFHAWGVPESWMGEARVGTFSAEHHLTYLGEVHVGAEVSVRVRCVARSARGLHVVGYLLDDTHRTLAYVMELLTLHVDLTTRRTRPWPDDVAAGLDRAVAAHAVLDWPVTGCLAVR